MLDGNWMRISGKALTLLPKDRPYGELEALVSLQCDYDSESEVTVAGYAALWGWSRGKVTRYLERLNVVIDYPEGTENIRKKRGTLKIHKIGNKQAISKHNRLIDSRQLAEEANIKHANNDHKESKNRSTTVSLSLSLNKHMVDFDQFWAIYPKKQGKQQAVKAWQKIKPDSMLFEKIMVALNAQAMSEAWQKDNGNYVPHPSTWLNGCRWEDELEPEQNQPDSGSQLVGGRRV
ncbi:MAG: hypothetical protein JRG71_10235, partial [Deltaproteobacteria bacterium]|nr:hypothetical protein [Deltaproteobacteria bacterium]